VYTCLWLYNMHVCRYVINYSPYDVVYKLCKFAPVRLLARALDQVHVAHHIHHGVNYALKHYTAAYIIAVVVGVAKGILLTDCDVYVTLYNYCINFVCSTTGEVSHRSNGLSSFRPNGLQRETGIKHRAYVAEVHGICYLYFCEWCECVYFVLCYFLIHFRRDVMCDVWYRSWSLFNETNWTGRSRSLETDRQQPSVSDFVRIPIQEEAICQQTKATVLACIKSFVYYHCVVLWSLVR